MEKKTVKNKHVPMRRCIGCMESKPKNDLVRLVDADGEIILDLTGRRPGRGVYICPDPECIETAAKKNALKRAFKRDIPKENIESIFEEIKNTEGKEALQ